MISIDSDEPETGQLPVDVRDEIIALWDARRDALMVHRAGTETISGDKTFTAALTATKRLALSNPTGQNPGLQLIHALISKTFDLSLDGNGDVVLTNVTTGEKPFVVDQLAVTNALQILAAAVQLGVDLDLNGHSLLNVGNVNVANGLLKLDSNGRVPSAQLSIDVMQFKGNWNASTNSPTLADGGGSPGDTYRVSTAGTQNLGSGAQTFDVGDWVFLSDTSVWQKGDMTDAVASVAGLTGAITAANLRTALSLVVGTDVQAYDSDLAAIAVLAPANDDFIQRKAGAWTNRTKAQVVADLIGAGLPYDISYLHSTGTHATGLGANGMGVRMARACTLSSVTFRCATADGSGTLTVELRRNGAQIASTVTNLAAANQVAGVTTAFTQAFAVGDILTVNVTAIGGSPGTGLIADITGVTA